MKIYTPPLSLSISSPSLSLPINKSPLPDSKTDVSMAEEHLFLVLPFCGNKFLNIHHKARCCGLYILEGCEQLCPIISHLSLSSSQ